MHPIEKDHVEVYKEKMGGSVALYDLAEAEHGKNCGDNAYVCVVSSRSVYPAVLLWLESHRGAVIGA
jgi:hypothetical protein